MKKDKKVMLILAVIVIAIIVVITLIQGNGYVDEETMQCIADNSRLIVSKTCSHCASQKKMLEPYLDKFNLLYVDEDASLWETYDLIGVPTWVINENTYPGVQQISKLKELTGC